MYTVNEETGISLDAISRNIPIFFHIIINNLAVCTQKN